MMFGPCPVEGRHYHEYWEKLQDERIDEGCVLKLKDVVVGKWSNEMTTEEMQAQTFKDFEWKEWELVMFGYYRRFRIVGIELEFYYPDSEDTFKDFRKYTPYNHNFYESVLEQEAEMILHWSDVSNFKVERVQ